VGTSPGSGTSRDPHAIDAIQAAIRDAGLGGWLLYDLHARNDVAARLIGLGDLSRRFFVLIPAEGEPLAVIARHRTGPWEQWPWQRGSTSAGSSSAALGETLSGVGTIAMEYSRTRRARHRPGPPASSTWSVRPA
jgi:Xaa-Pro dipeptidase